MSSDPDQVARAAKIVLPGVGHFRQAMLQLKERGLVSALHEAVVSRCVPVLGICLGMHLMATQGEEGDAPGLGWLDATVVRFRMTDPVRFKVPHIGWNRALPRKESPLLAGVPPESEFYFVHGYHVVVNDPSDVLCETEYGYPFTSAVARGNIFGVQFHPEKSHDSGDRILRNFVAL